MEKIVCADRVRNEALERVEEEKNILQRVKRKKANMIGHILRWNCLLKHVIEGDRGRIEVTGRRKRICKQLLHAFMDKW